MGWTKLLDHEHLTQVYGDGGMDGRIEEHRRGMNEIALIYRWMEFSERSRSSVHGDHGVYVV